MTLIQNFREIRRDGKVIEAGVDMQAILALGWSPDKIVRLEWEADGRTIHRDCPHGVLAKVLPDRMSIALMEHTPVDTGMRKKLSVIDADGTTRYVIADTHVINGRALMGVFAWFEPARVEPERCFGVIFQTVPDADGTQEQYQFDLDIASGEIVGAYESR
ncbi:hypothetical protein IV454_23840 [Massilia antarctica]|uniref:Uncharacterized protein n=1 Tax=Massilia antarctica TaxID=2765360 RepID=A0AA48WC34_9BURK|nr:hypothetical protein [Massilia antarctica]QPI48535.1 hypothetical protein IV454_23840 [Massilia antarctica]